MTFFESQLRQHFPENSQGGECGVFAEQICQFGPIGGLYIDKQKYVQLNGIISGNIAEIGKGFRVGDVLILDVDSLNGHVAVLLDPSKMTVVESNFNLDGKVHYGRIIDPKQIYGIIRAPLKIDLGQCVVNYNVFFNNQKFKDLSFLTTIQEWILQWTNNKLKVNFFPLNTNCENWWYQDFVFNGVDYKVIAKEYMDNQVAPLAFTSDNKPSDLFAFVVTPAQWEGSAGGGQEFAWTTDVKPGQVQIASDENTSSPWYSTMKLINHALIHELSHYLHYINGLNDPTDLLDYPPSKKLESVFNDLDFNRIQINL